MGEGNREFFWRIAVVVFLVAVLLPWTLSLVWKKYQMPHEPHPQPTSFHDWRAGDFEVWGAKLHCADAAIDVLLPLQPNETSS